MSLTDLPVLDVLRTQMKWHQTRQRVLAENVANADTPGYQARDLRPVDFSQFMGSSSMTPVAAAQTHQSHLGGATLSGTQTDFDIDADGDFEITPSGNAVVLEEQMMNVTANQMDYQAATTLYSKSMNLLRIAIGQNSR